MRDSSQNLNKFRIQLGKKYRFHWKHRLHLHNLYILIDCFVDILCSFQYIEDIQDFLVQIQEDRHYIRLYNFEQVCNLH